MFFIVSNILIVLISILDLDSVSALPILVSEENDLEFNFDNSIDYLDNFYDRPFLFAAIDPSIAEDARLETPELITKYGYTAETHYVTTDDGYILQLHRISGAPTSPPRPGKKAIFYMHGILDSSAGVVLSGPKNALAFILADNGYDVWLGNSRGNTYSANHTTFRAYGSARHQRKFWAFSWHEIGIYDVPASIDYVLQQTNQKKLTYVAHSQGATAFFVMLSERPEYNDKVEMMHALAPAVFLSHTKSPLIRAIVPFISVVRRVKDFIGFNYFSAKKWMRSFLGEKICRDSMPTQLLCKGVIFMLMGYDSDQLNSTTLPVILGHTPAGCSTSQLVHFGQSVKYGHFRQYDHGWFSNLRKYKWFNPPDYNLKNVRTPVAVYYSENDWLANVKDVHKLLQTLPNVVKSYEVPHKQFNHIDFLWGTDAPLLVYYELVQTIKSSHS